MWRGGLLRSRRRVGWVVRWLLAVVLLVGASALLFYEDKPAWCNALAVVVIVITASAAGVLIAPVPAVVAVFTPVVVLTLVALSPSRRMEFIELLPYNAVLVSVLAMILVFLARGTRDLLASIKRRRTERLR